MAPSPANFLDAFMQHTRRHAPFRTTSAFGDTILVAPHGFQGVAYDIRQHVHNEILRIVTNSSSVAPRRARSNEITTRLLEALLLGVADDLNVRTRSAQWLRVTRGEHIQDSDSNLWCKPTFVVFRGHAPRCVVLTMPRHATPAQAQDTMAQGMLAAAILSDQHSDHPDVSVITTNLHHWQFRRVGRALWERSPELETNFDDLDPHFIGELHDALGTLAHYFSTR